MLTRLLPVSRLAIKNALGRQSVRNMGGHMSEREIAVITKTTMDDLPQPTGSWQEGYQAKSRKQNMMLLGNVLAFVLIHYVMLVEPVTRETLSYPDHRTVEVDWDTPDIPPVEVVSDD